MRFHASVSFVSKERKNLLATLVATLVATLITTLIVTIGKKRKCYCKFVAVL